MNLLEFITQPFNNFSRKIDTKVNDTPYSYILVRKDIPLFAQLVQSAHAVHHVPVPPDNTHLILLQIEDEMELFLAFRRLMMQGIQMRPFFEPDYDMGMTAIATVNPLYSEEDRAFMLKYEKWTAPGEDPANTPSLKELTKVS